MLFLKISADLSGSVKVRAPYWIPPGLRYLIGEHVGVDTRNIHGYIIGELAVIPNCPYGALQQ